MGKKFPNDDTGIAAGDPAGLRPRGHQINDLLSRRAPARSRKSTSSTITSWSAVYPWSIIPCNSSATGAAIQSATKPLHAHRSDRRGEAMRPQRSGDLAEVAVGKLQ